MPAPTVNVCPTVIICCCLYRGVCVNRGLEVRGALIPGWAQTDRGALSGHRGLSLAGNVAGYGPIGDGKQPDALPILMARQGRTASSPTWPVQHSEHLQWPVFWTAVAGCPLCPVPCPQSCCCQLRQWLGCRVGLLVDE
jgi:hypothetical protein